jgi:hypothetical protein
VTLALNMFRTPKVPMRSGSIPKLGITILLPRNLYSRHTANGILKDAGIAKKILPPKAIPEGFCLGEEAFALW